MRLFLVKQYACLFVFILLLGACKSIGPIEVEKDRYELPGITVVDTISIQTNEYTYYHLTADQPWILIDTQTVYSANQLITFVVIENTEVEERMAKITIMGEGLEPKEIEVIQGPGGRGSGYSGDFGEASDYEPDNSFSQSGGSFGYEDQSAPSGRRIKTENAMVDIPAEPSAVDVTVGAEEPVTADTTKSAPEEKTPPVEEPKYELDISSDKVNLGAADELESDPITVKSNVKWTLQTSADWLVVLDNDGAEVKEGTQSQALRIRTTKANTALKPRTSEITFIGEHDIKRVIVVTQKETEAKLDIDKTAIALSAESATAKDKVLINAEGTNFTISQPPSWLKLSATVGKIGENTIDISATDDNTTGADRKVVLHISSTGDVIKKELTVTQPSLPSPIDVSELSGNLERDKESIQTFTITASKDWTIKMPKVSWFNVDILSGKPDEEEVTITVTALEDNTGLPRKAYLQVISGKFKRNVEVIQDGDEEGEPVGAEEPVAEAPKPAPETTAKQVEESAEVDVATPKEGVEFVVKSGTLQGEFAPYVLLGNPKLFEENPSSTPASATIKVSSNVDFVIENEPFDNLDTFYAIVINQTKYQYKEVIKKGTDIEITLRASSDNIQKQDNSKVSHLLFKTASGEKISFVDMATASDEKLEKLEIKQESYVFKRPFIKVYGLDFDGYNSNLLLGNPGSRGEDALPTTVTITLEANTAFALSLLLEGDEKKKHSQYTISYVNTKSGKEKRYSYKLGEKLEPGAYSFTFSVKKNFVDPQGVGSRYTESLIFNVVEGKTLTPYEYVDMDNYSVDLSYFRELFLVEQESFDTGAEE